MLRQTVIHILPINCVQGIHGGLLWKANRVMYSGQPNKPTLVLGTRRHYVSVQKNCRRSSSLPTIPVDWNGTWEVVSSNPLIWYITNFTFRQHTANYGPTWSQPLNCRSKTENTGAESCGNWKDTCAVTMIHCLPSGQVREIHALTCGHLMYCYGNIQLAASQLSLHANQSMLPVGIPFIFEQYSPKSQ